MSEYDEPISHLAEEKLAWQARALKAEAKCAEWKALYESADARADKLMDELAEATTARLQAEAVYESCKSERRRERSARLKAEESFQELSTDYLRAEEALREIVSICKKADTAEDDLDFAGALLAVGVAARAALSGE